MGHKTLRYGNMFYSGRKLKQARKASKWYSFYGTWQEQAGRPRFEGTSASHKQLRALLVNYYFPATYLRVRREGLTEPAIKTYATRRWHACFPSGGRLFHPRLPRILSVILPRARRDRAGASAASQTIARSTERKASASESL